MVKIIFSKGNEVKESKFRFKHNVRRLDIIVTFLKLLERGISWKLEFIDVDPEERRRWKNYEELAKKEWKAILQINKSKRTKHSSDSQPGSFSPFPIGMPISASPQITEKPKPGVEILSGGHILLVEGEEVTFVIVPN